VHFGAFFLGKFWTFLLFVTFFFYILTFINIKYFLACFSFAFSFKNTYYNISVLFQFLIEVYMIILLCNFVFTL